MADLMENNANGVNTGINAVDSFFRTKRNKNVQEIVRMKVAAVLIKNGFSFISSHSKYSEEELISIFNEKIKKIVFSDKFESRNLGIAHVNSQKKKLYFWNDLFDNNRWNNDIQRIVVHELTHAVGEKTTKTSIFHKISQSGYKFTESNLFSRYAYEKNEAFNEALVETFANLDRPFRMRNAFGHSVFTNLNSDFYMINSCLVNQMLIAKGINQEQWIDGLFNSESAEKVLSSFDKKTFRSLSRNMLDIFELCKAYSRTIENSYNDMHSNKNDSILGYSIQSMAIKKDLGKCIEESEKLIIDDILLPELNGKSIEEKNKLLRNYRDFIVLEKQYFRGKTGFAPDANDSEKKKSLVNNAEIANLKREEVKNIDNSRLDEER